jgi:hypothetical protein
MHDCLLHVENQHVGATVVHLSVSNAHGSQRPFQPKTYEITALPVNGTCCLHQQKPKKNKKHALCSQKKMYEACKHAHTPKTAPTPGMLLPTSTIAPATAAPISIFEGSAARDLNPFFKILNAAPPSTLQSSAKADATTCNCQCFMWLYVAHVLA